MAGDFFAAYTGDRVPGKPRLVEAPSGHMFSDCPERVVLLVNLASVRDLERVTGAPVDPLRFRANLYFAGTEPWQEFAWLEDGIAIGGARLRIVGRIDRCAATNVNPATAGRDMNLPKALSRGFGHADMGVYGTVTGGGVIAVGDALRAPA